MVLIPTITHRPRPHLVEVPSRHGPPAVAHRQLRPLTQSSVRRLAPLRTQRGHSVAHGQRRRNRTVLHRVVHGGHLQGARHRELSVTQGRQRGSVVVEHGLLLGHLLLVLLVDVADGVGLVVDVLLRGMLLLLLLH